MSAIAARPNRVGLALAEARKVPAFVRRDFLVAWSYRFSFVTDLVGLVGQALVFYFVGQMVDPGKLGTFDGAKVDYLEFAAVGMALGTFIHFGLNRVGAALRGEQLMGTLESVFATPTSAPTIQFGSVAFDLLYIPVRTALFILVMALAFGLHFDAAGILPAIAVLIVFMPFVWGLGVVGAAATLTFRRGSGLIGLGTMILALLSGLYFPIALLPHWLSSVVADTPIALAVHAMRETLLGGGSWSDIAGDIAVLAPLSLGALALGVVAFRLALRRERRLGTLGLY
jgi:ABC-2 type transport system permease protein